MPFVWGSECFHGLGECCHCSFPSFINSFSLYVDCTDLSPILFFPLQLTTRTDIRNSVDSYIRDKTKKAAAIAAVESAAIPIAAGISPYTVPAPLKIPPIPSDPIPSVHVPILISQQQQQPIIQMRPPPPPGGPPPGIAPIIIPVSFAPQPPQPVERSSMMLPQGLPLPLSSSEFHQGAIPNGPASHMMPNLAISGGGFYPPGMLVPGAMSMMMPGQGPDMWALQQAQAQAQA